MDDPSEEQLARARDLHRRAVVIDTHCDTTQRLLNDSWDFGERHAYGHVDLPRLQEGGVRAVFFAVYAPDSPEPGVAVAAARTQLAKFRDLTLRYAPSVALARTAADVGEAQAKSRVAVLIGIEGGHLIDDSLEILREYHDQGATYLTLTHAEHNHWADSAGVHEPLLPRHGGLTEFGREVVRELNRLGVMVDVSHVSDDTFWDVLETSVAPVIASHSSCRSVAPHRRNLSDEMIRAVAAGGGTVQINFAALFVDPGFPALDPEAAQRSWARWWTHGDGADEPVTNHVTPLSRLVDHFDHAIQLVGPGHVGIGSDFDGTLVLPRGMEDCSKLPYLTAALLERGHGEEEVAKVLGANVLRVMETCQRLARSP